MTEIEPVAYLIERLTADGEPYTSSLRFNAEPEAGNVRVTPLCRHSPTAVSETDVEAVARAIAAAIDEDYMEDHGRYDRQARAAIEAAREAKS